MPKNPATPAVIIGANGAIIARCITSHHSGAVEYAWAAVSGVGGACLINPRIGKLSRARKLLQSRGYREADSAICVHDLLRRFLII